MEKGGRKNSGNGFVILHNCGCGKQADSTEFPYEEMTDNCEDCAFLNLPMLVCDDGYWCIKHAHSVGETN